MTSDVKALVLTVRDRSCPHRSRLHAARSALWSLEHEHGWTDLDLTLAEAMVSRWLDGVTPSSSGENELIEMWRTDRLANEAGRVSPTEAQLPLVAKLLYDCGEYAAAIPFFERAVRSTQVDAETVLLAAYSHEHLARQTGDAEEVTAALNLLDEKRFRSFPEAEQLLAESLHLRGHLYLMKDQLEGRQAGAFSQLGTDLLRQAADLDPSYASCFTSSYAERGDYVRSISASLEVLRERPFDLLAPHEANIVALEVLFYLSYGLLSIGEYERARLCLASFIEAVDRLEDDEARDHARLFMVKLELKRRIASDFSASELAGYYAELRALAFTSPLSEPVAAETRRYERVIEFLMALVDVRDRLEQSAYERDGGNLLFERARELIRTLVEERPSLLAGPVGVAIELAEDDAASSLASLREFAPVCRQLSTRPAGFAAALREAAEEHDVVAVWLASAQATVSVQDLLAVPGRSLIVHCPTEETVAANVRADSAEEFRDLVVAGCALSLAKRFLIDDEYIFGLTPCAQSPAVKFQLARYSIEEIRAL
jgi:tetratricopeptide (TPR) repeat protein